MRKDIGKVITERPRAHSGDKTTRKGYKKQLGKEGLDRVKREPIKAMKGDSREFTDVLGPLVGFLNKNVGRPWDKIFSEICEVLPAKGGVSISHARDHLFRFVAQDVKLINKKPCYSKPHRTFSIFSKDVDVPISEQFFVHPDSKVLLKNKYWRSYRWRKGDFKPLAVEIDGNHYIEMDGVWYQVELKTLDLNKETQVVDVLLRRSFYFDSRHHSYSELRIAYGNGHTIATSKRQLNTREIKKLNLRG